jgi:hypothetical protein
MHTMTFTIEGRTFIGRGDSCLNAGLIMLVGVCEYYKPTNVFLIALEQMILGNLDDAVNAANEPYWELRVS